MGDRLGTAGVVGFSFHPFLFFFLLLFKALTAALLHATLYCTIKLQWTPFRCMQVWPADTCSILNDNTYWNRPAAPSCTIVVLDGKTPKGTHRYTRKQTVLQVLLCRSLSLGTIMLACKHAHTQTVLVRTSNANHACTYVVSHHACAHAKINAVQVTRCRYWTHMQTLIIIMHLAMHAN